MLPEPRSVRFQPLRSGLINLFKYENQQFWFEQGRLLVRGNNGTGKSRVLALQLPFLLDGEIRPERVEPDGDRARQLAWHLHMDEHDQRTGYTWIEFGRRDEQGVAHYVTVGCGMKAVRGQDGQPTRWFFVTPLRVDQDFDLLAGTRPLTSEQLGDRIGEACLTKIAREHRRAVDARLFSLGEERYGALLDLLIRLRAPQLAKKLEEKLLYAALSDSLPPLDSELVEKVASAFRDLDDLRHQFDALTQLARIVEEFGEDYRRYAQAVVARRAAHLRTAHNDYEKLHSALTGLKRKIEQARLAEEEAQIAAGKAQDEARVAGARFDALQQSSTAGLAQSLNYARAAAEGASARAKETSAEAEAADVALTQAGEELDSGERQASDADGALEECLRQSSGTATAAGVAEDHQRIISPSADAWPRDSVALTALRKSYDALERSHLRRLDTVDALLAARTKTAEALRSAQAVETQKEEEVARLRGAEQERDREARSAATRLAADYQSWSVALRWLQAPPWSEIGADVDLWLDTAVEANRPLPRRLEAIAHDEVDRVAAERERLATATRELESRRLELLEEETRLQVSPPPPAPPSTRAPDCRQDRAGAPLWQTCEFAPDLSPAERAGLEAALEAAGLLDAWITPDGRLLTDLPADTFLLAEDESASSADARPTLADWLLPDPAANTSVSVPPEIVRAVLSRIAAGPVGDSAHWVALDGRWRLGPVRGRGQKVAAQHLGAASREAERLLRLRAVAAELAKLDETQAELSAARARLTARVSDGAAERDRAPSDAAVAQALAQRTLLGTQLVSARSERDEAVTRTQVARSADEAAQNKLFADARGLGFSAFLDRLGSLRDAWRGHELALARLWPAAQVRVDRQAAVALAQSRRIQAAERCESAAAQAETARGVALEANATYDALQAQVGTTVVEFETQLNAVRAQREAKAQAQRDAEAAASRAAQALAGTKAMLAPEEQNVTQAKAARDEATARLRLPLHHGLFSEAQPELVDIERDDWSPTRAIDIARRIDRVLPGANLGDKDWTNLQNDLQIRLTDLRNRAGPLGCQARSEIVAPELSVVICSYQGIDHTPSGLRGAVLAELEARERLLNEQERGIIEKHLVSEVSARLQVLIDGAIDRRDKMNAEMTRCATTLGVSLRLVWEPVQDDSLPAGLRAAIKLIRADHGAWTDAERAQVGALLHQLIRDQRQREPAATWSEQLAHALDYRRWYAFGAERRQKERWERLTRQRYGTGSGGEKALMLTIPQMAAASSHYLSAAPHAPRLILLDEAFAGMDKPTRARCMGLLDVSAFDLDLLMTSEREWGAHASVAGIAIYQLVADDEAISATRWVWNGRVKRLAPVPDTPEQRPTDHSSSQTDELALG